MTPALEEAVTAVAEDQPETSASGIASAADAAQAVDAQNPWPGLATFNEKAAPFFNGREDESAELARLVAQAPLTILFGKSGLGKSSLLNAGLFPLLRDTYLPVSVRLAVQQDGARLIDQLEAALIEQVKERSVELAPSDFQGGLWERLHHQDFALWRAKTRPLTPIFVLDQFEEVFTLGAANPAAIDELRIDLADLIENRIPARIVKAQEQGGEALLALDIKRQRYKVLLSLREDFLVELESWRRHIPSLMRNRFRLTAMSADQAFAAVFRTGKAGHLVDKDTARAIVRFVGNIQEDDRTATSARDGTDAADESVMGAHEIEPALLSLVCSELNKLRQRAKPAQPSITADLLKGTGASIIADFYLRKVAQVPATTRKFIEENLLTEGGYRNSFPVAEALRDGKLSEQSLGRLIDDRVLRIEHQLGTERVELTHDRLTDVVRTERDRRRQKERSASMRRWIWVAAAIGLVLVAAGGWVLFNEAATARAQAERDEANRQREITKQALAEAQSQRDEADRQRERAERALADVQKQRDEVNTQRERAEKAFDEANRQRKRVEEALQQLREQQAKAKIESERAAVQTQKATYQSNVLEEVYGPFRASVLRLRLSDSTATRTATAFLLSNRGLAVTPGHVIAGRAGFGDSDMRSAAIMLTDFAGGQHKATLVKLYDGPDLDLALLRLEDVPTTPCLQLANQPVSVGMPVVALYVTGGNWKFFSGVVSDTDTSTKPGFAAKDLIGVEMEAHPAFSGAAVMDAGSKRVVGLGAYKSGENLSFLIPASRIRAVLGNELGANPCPSQ